MSLYVALDGPDGCGKSSQTEALVGWLCLQGHQVQHVREPGSTPVGEALRELLLSPSTGELQPVTEALLFSAARAELVARVIAPARARGEIIVAERCFLSTAVYQILATARPAPVPESQLPEALAPEPQLLEQPWFDDLTRRVHGACLPDRIFVLDVPPAVAVQRRAQRADDRIEARGAAYHGRVRDGFLLAAERETRAQVVDAARSFNEVQAELRAACGRLLS